MQHWRTWSVIVVLLLANYLVFSSLATLVFPPTPITAPTHAAKPTFTRSIIELRNVGTLSYDFLTPTVTPTITATPTLTATATLTIPSTGPAVKSTAVPTAR